MSHEEAVSGVMARVREAFKSSGLTLHVVGCRMGYEGEVARVSVWNLLNKVSDPRVSTLVRFAEAVDVSAAYLLTGKGKS